MKNEVRISQVSFGSDYYFQAKSLRNLYLRAPLGLEFTPEELIQDQQACHVVALYQEKVIGSVMGVPEIDRTRVRQMIVTPEYQRQGVGSLLLQQLEKICYQAGTGQFYLHARLTSIDFYRKNGYDTRGKIFLEVGIEHQVMVKFF